MNGDMIETMSEAVENSKAMIVCMSENYKLSPYCKCGKCTILNLISLPYNQEFIVSERITYLHCLSVLYVFCM